MTSIERLLWRLSLVRPIMAEQRNTNSVGLFWRASDPGTPVDIGARCASLAPLWLLSRAVQQTGFLSTSQRPDQWAKGTAACRQPNFTPHHVQRFALIDPKSLLLHDAILFYPQKSLKCLCAARHHLCATDCLSVTGDG